VNVKAPTAQQIIDANKYICMQGRNPHHCYDPGKIESSIHTAFYPGSYPFAAGGLARIAGALCFYLVKNHAFMDGNKRTAALAAIVFLNNNGLDLKYAQKEANGRTALANIIEDCAAGKITKDQLMNWFDSHKVKQR
jgi:death on curing protein